MSDFFQSNVQVFWLNTVFYNFILDLFEFGGPAKNENEFSRHLWGAGFERRIVEFDERKRRSVGELAQRKRRSVDQKFRFDNWNKRFFWLHCDK
jgi:hypothetical protein